jgi:hypothetical protein
VNDKTIAQFAHQRQRPRRKVIQFPSVEAPITLVELTRAIEFVLQDRPSQLRNFRRSLLVKLWHASKIDDKTVGAR